MSELLRDSVFEQLKTHERHKDNFYPDKYKNATIGVGYTPVVKGQGGTWLVRPEAEADFKAAGVTLSDKHKRAFEVLAYAKNNPAAKDAKARQDSAMKNLADISINDDQGKALSGRLIDESIRHAEKTIGKERFDKLEDKRKTALAGAAYQSPANMSKIGPELGKAIDAKDWTKAASVLEESGKRLGDQARYKSYGTEMRDPATPGKVQAQTGDSLWSLAKQHGVSLDELRAANPNLGKNGAIRAGDYLNLPKAAEPQPQNPQEPVSSEAPSTEPPSSEEPAPQPQEPQQKQSELGDDGRAFMDRLSQPLARPALEVAVKAPTQWTEEEAKSVIDDYGRYPQPEAMNNWLRERTMDFYQHRYGKSTWQRGLDGRMVEAKPGITPIVEPQPAKLPDGRPLLKMLEQLGGKLAPAFDVDGMSNATRSMQRGLNLVNGDRMPKLKEDGDWGPITDFSFKKSVAAHGPARIDEGFALGRLQTIAEKPQQPQDLAKKTQDILGPLYGSHQGGREPEPLHAYALQMGLNEIGPKHVADWQPLKPDGEIGPKTTSAFNQVAETAGPMSLARDFGNWLGWM
ncbi:MAG: LysM peptidoglycan-binding domain-containing protein [Alphaproteobacteria bacterium]|nr:LysM peptidoglycan-binding domain-containing protein [Alphaproteobacteria bacterium]